MTVNGNIEFPILVNLMIYSLKAIVCKLILLNCYFTVFGAAKFESPYVDVGELKS